MRGTAKDFIPPAAVLAAVLAAEVAEAGAAEPARR